MATCAPHLSRSRDPAQRTSALPPAIPEGSRAPFAHETRCHLLGHLLCGAGIVAVPFVHVEVKCKAPSLFRVEAAGDLVS